MKKIKVKQSDFNEFNDFIKKTLANGEVELTDHEIDLMSLAWMRRSCLAWADKLSKFVPASVYGTKKEKLQAKKAKKVLDGLIKSNEDLCLSNSTFIATIDRAFALNKSLMETNIHLTEINDLLTEQLNMRGENGNEDEGEQWKKQ